MTSIYKQKEPQVMGIINITSDSFYADSRCETKEAILSKVNQFLSEGASIFDLGACSTRPGSAPVSEEEEMARMEFALKVIRETHPDICLSVDTFRASVARMAGKEYNVQIINDVYGCDPKMAETVAELGCTYVYMHATEVDSSSPNELIRKIFTFFAEGIQSLQEKGVRDIIIDPGFGFGKTMDQNFELLALTHELKALNCPILVGISRKRMIWQTLDITPEDALNGTTVLNTMALSQGADILRVHDVKEAKQCIDLFDRYNIKV